VASRKEDVQGDTYKGIKKFRFYMKCMTCSREITFITDPEKMDYAMEHGAKRLFEVWKEQEKAEKEEGERRAEEEQQDAMKALEHRTIDSKLEMDILDALEETKVMGNKRDLIRGDRLVEMYGEGQREGGKGGEEEEEEEARRAFALARKGGVGGLKKLEDSDEEGGGMGGREGKRARGTEHGLLGAATGLSEGSGTMLKPLVRIKAKKRKAEENGGKEGKEGGNKMPKGEVGGEGKPKPEEGERRAEAKEGAGVEKGAGGQAGGGLQGLLASYGSSSEGE
jgi:hypothetical protein